MDLDLLEKTELRIDGVTTAGTNLTDLAATVACVLGLPPDKVMVIDVRPGQLALDVLARSVPAERLFGRKNALLAALAAVPGVSLDAEVEIHAAGILGTIALDQADAARALRESRAIGRRVAASRKARVRVFPTGFELQERRIEDTNTPYLVKLFAEAGYLAEAGPALPDSLDGLIAALGSAARECALVITTGGVGAEDKDFSVEAVLALDPGAAAPYLVRFQEREGRHVKDGVRLAVGECNGCRIATLPGPHDEVRLAGPVLVQGMKRRWGKEELAARLAERVRGKFRAARGSGSTPIAHGSHGCDRKRGA